jgi:hypothetical protein
VRVPGRPNLANSFFAGVSRLTVATVKLYEGTKVRPRTKPSGKLGNSKIDGLNFARLEETKFRTEKKKFRPENCRILPCGTLWPGSPGKRRFFLLVVLHLVCPYTLVLEMYFLHRSQRRVFARSWRPRKTTDRNVIERRVALHIVERRKL